MPNSDAAPVFIIAVVCIALAHHLWHRRERGRALIPAVLAGLLLWNMFPAVHPALNTLRHAAGQGVMSLAPTLSTLLYLVIVLVGIKMMFGGLRRCKR